MRTAVALFGVLAMVAGTSVVTAPAGTSERTFASTEVSVFSSGLPTGALVHVVTVFTADGEDYGYYLGSGVYRVRSGGNVMVHLDLSDVKNGEDDESGTVRGWFYLDGEQGYGPPIVRSDGEPAVFTLEVP